MDSTFCLGLYLYIITDHACYFHQITYENYKILTFFDILKIFFKHCLLKGVIKLCLACAQIVP